MKGKFIIVSIFFFLCFSSMPVLANYTPVEPNKYEEKKIKWKTEYLHEKSLLNRKTKISEEQKMLSFEPKQMPTNNEVKTLLFTSNDVGNNTITAKAEELAIFSDGEKHYTVHVGNEQSHYKESSIWLNILYGLAVVISFGLLIFVLGPKLNHSDS
jgi:type VII secretion protein EssA